MFPGKEHGYDLRKVAMLLRLLLLERSGMRKLAVSLFHWICPLAYRTINHIAFLRGVWKTRIANSRE